MISYVTMTYAHLDSWQEKIDKIIDSAYADYRVFLDDHIKRTNTCGPHCDSWALHRPGACEVCDTHASDLQIVRQQLHIGFTETAELPKGWRPCPATVRRSVEKIERWGSNRPK